MALALRCSAVLVLGLALPALAAETVLDDFDEAGAPAPWQLLTDATAPGALTVAPGYQGNGAHVTFSFAANGSYAGLSRSYSAPVAADALGFFARSTPGVGLTLGVTDGSGQTLSYALARPLTAVDPGAWYRQVVDLTQSTSHSGGANDGQVHGGIAAIAVVVDRALIAGLSGSLDFDQLVAITPLATALDPFNGLLFAPDAGADDLFAGLGVELHYTDLDSAALDLAADAGFHWVRLDLGWQQVEIDAGVYDFSLFDPVDAALAARGMEMHYIFDYSNTLYSDGTIDIPGTGEREYAPQSARSVQAFANYVSASVAHFGSQVNHYEVWNEPNVLDTWPPVPSAAQYAALANAALAAAHAANPAAQVSTAGLGQGPVYVAGIAISSAAFAWSYLQGYVADGLAGPDAVGYHPYRSTKPEGFTDELCEVRALAAAAYAAPVWDTEWGYSAAYFGAGHSAADLDLQARYDVRELLAVRAAGLPFGILYDLVDDGTSSTDPEQNFGLLAADRSDKPAMVAVRALHAVADGRRLAGALDGEPSTVHALRFDGVGDVAVALWNEAAGTTAQVSFAAPAAASDHLGQPLALTLDGDGGASLALTETLGPVYLVWPRPAAVPDAGVSVVDAGVDAGQSLDGGPAADAGIDAGPDAGTSSDAGPALDVGQRAQDGGSVDAGPGADGGSAPVTAGGCSCSTPGDALLPVLLALALQGRRRHRSRPQRLA